MFFNMYEKAPCVCFKADFPSAGSAREDLSRILSSHLLARFGAVKQGSLVLSRGQRQWIEVPLGQRAVWVVWYPRRQKVGEWILFVGPGDWPSLWDRVWGRKRVANTEELKVVSRDIHALLGSVTGISNVMWYFSEFRRKGKKGVWTPDELPWTEP
jgi:hypothetical protein